MAGVLNEGEQIGVVSNYLDHPNGTSRHLHFDVQVFTRDGWIWVNPYATLISGYERLIRGSGRELVPIFWQRLRSRMPCRRIPSIPALRKAPRTERRPAISRSQA